MVIVEWHICVPPGLVNVSKFMHSLMSDTANMAPSKLVPNTEPKSIKGRSIQQIDHVLILMPLGVNMFRFLSTIFQRTQRQDKTAKADYPHTLSFGFVRFPSVSFGLAWFGDRCG